MKNLTLLYPTDFSDFSRQTLENILPLIKNHNNKLILLHAASHTKANETADRVRISESFTEFTESLGGLGDIDYETRWHFGISSEVIVREADHVEIDLIVMGTKGAKGWDRLWGSKTEAVVRQSITPVLVIPEGASIHEIQSIVLAMDYDQPLEETRLHLLKRIAGDLETEIDVLNVLHRESELSRPEKRRRKMLKNYLYDLPHRFSSHFEDEVSEGLTKYAEEQEAGLIAVMPRSYGFLERVFTESISQKMVYQSKLPLLILV